MPKLESLSGRTLLVTTATREVTELRQELTALRAENVRLAELAAGRAASEARFKAELRLLRRELDGEWGALLDGVQREAQSALVRHLNERQELQAAHHKALQRAEFDRLDMLAQQEARTKVREGQLFGHVLEQVARLKRSLSERSNGGEELVRLLQAQQRSEDELEALRSERSPRGKSAPRPPPATTAAAATPTAPACAANAAVSPPPSSIVYRATAAHGASYTPSAPPPPPPASKEVTPADAAAQGSHRSLAQRPPVSACGFAGASGGAASSPLPHCGLSSPTARLTPASEAEALLEQLRKADERQAEARRCHALEIAQCDEQSAKLRAALTSIEARLQSTEGALRTARETANTAESAKARALVDRAESQRVVADLHCMLNDANAHIAALGGERVRVTASGRAPLHLSFGAPHKESAAATALALHSFAPQATGSGGDASSARPVIPRLSFANLRGAVGRAAAPPSPRADAAAEGLGLEAELDEELLLSQRALDFLAELPGTNPATPISSIRSASPVLHTSPSSPLPLGLSEFRRFCADALAQAASPSVDAVAHPTPSKSQQAIE